MTKIENSLFHFLLFLIFKKNTYKYLRKRQNMKILAFSDWEIQSIALINNILDKENPDVILYAGDHLSRFIEIKETFYRILLNLNLLILRASLFAK